MVERLEREWNSWQPGPEEEEGAWWWWWRLAAHHMPAASCMPPCLLSLFSPCLAPLLVALMYVTCCLPSALYYLISFSPSYYSQLPHCPLTLIPCARMHTFCLPSPSSPLSLSKIEQMKTKDMHGHFGVWVCGIYSAVSLRKKSSSNNTSSSSHTSPRYYAHALSHPLYLVSAQPWLLDLLRSPLPRLSHTLCVL